MMSYLDAFYKLIGEELTTKLIEAGYIKMEVFAAIRGRSFSNCIILVDEFQNITHDNAKTLLTRFSDNTKLVILGDTGQIDIRNKTESSLDSLANNVNANPIDGSREGYGTFYIKRKMDDPSISKEAKEKPALLLGFIDYLDGYRQGKDYDEFKKNLNLAASKYSEFTKSEINRLNKDPKISVQHAKNYANRLKK